MKKKKEKHANEGVIHLLTMFKHCSICCERKDRTLTHNGIQNTLGQDKAIIVGTFQNFTVKLNGFALVISFCQSTGLTDGRAFLL